MRSIPEELKILAVAAVRFFGSNKDVILMETLVKYDCIEEERLERILRFDHRLLESQISNLLRERMVHKRLKPAEVGMKRKSKISVYYFVNYKSLVDIVHFKLYRMRRTLEESIAKANQEHRRFFKCSNIKCLTEFRELQARELFHPSKNQFICVFCQNVVQEICDVKVDDDSGRMAKFNEYTQPLLLKAQAASAFCIEEEPEPDWTGEQRKSMTVHLVHSETESEDQMETSGELIVASRDNSDPGLMMNCDSDTVSEIVKNCVSTDGSLSCNPAQDEISVPAQVLVSSQNCNSKTDSALNVLKMLKRAHTHNATMDNLVEFMSDSDDDIRDNQSDSDSFQSVEDN